MEIIKHGKLHGIDDLMFNCDACGCKFIARRNEYDIGCVEINFMDYYMREKAQCHECSKTCDVPIKGGTT